MEAGQAAVTSRLRQRDVKVTSYQPTNLPTNRTNQKEIRDGCGKLAASRPSPFTIDHAMAYLTRSLKTKTGDAPSRINQVVRSAYHPLIAFDKDFPGHLAELIERVDRLDRGHDATWYGRAVRGLVQTLRHERLTAQARRAMPPPVRSVMPQREAEVQHTAVRIGQVLADLLPG